MEFYMQTKPIHSNKKLFFNDSVTYELKVLHIKAKTYFCVFVDTTYKDNLLTSLILSLTLRTCNNIGVSWIVV